MFLHINITTKQCSIMRKLFKIIIRSPHTYFYFQTVLRRILSKCKKQHEACNTNPAVEYNLQFMFQFPKNSFKYYKKWEIHQNMFYDLFINYINDHHWNKILENTIKKLTSYYQCGLHHWLVQNYAEVHFFWKHESYL